MLFFSPPWSSFFGWCYLLPVHAITINDDRSQLPQGGSYYCYPPYVYRSPHESPQQPTSSENEGIFIYISYRVLFVSSKQIVLGLVHHDNGREYGKSQPHHDDCRVHGHGHMLVSRQSCLRDERGGVVGMHLRVGERFYLAPSKPRVARGQG